MRHVLKFLTHLPLPVLYALGRFAYFVTYHVLRWHRELAARNLAKAFPEKSAEERAKLLRARDCRTWAARRLQVLERAIHVAKRQRSTERRRGVLSATQRGVAEPKFPLTRLTGQVRDRDLDLAWRKPAQQFGKRGHLRAPCRRGGDALRRGDEVGETGHGRRDARAGGSIKSECGSLSRMSGWILQLRIPVAPATLGRHVEDGPDGHQIGRATGILPGIG